VGGRRDAAQPGKQHGEGKTGDGLAANHTEKVGTPDRTSRVPIHPDRAMRPARIGTKVARRSRGTAVMTTLEENGARLMQQHRHHNWPAVAAGALAVGALSAGCGSSGTGTATGATPKTVDDAQVEQGIKASLSTSSVAATSAKCPTDIPVEKGDTFTCTVTFDNGATGEAKVTQHGLGRYTYELKSGSVQVPGATADAAVEHSLAAQGLPNATADCPANIIVKVGTTVTCNLSGAGGAASGTVTFTFSDAEGTVDASSVKT
jgi:hypothetical protein